MRWMDGVLETLARTGFDLRSQFAKQWLGLAMWQYIVAFLLIALSLFARRIITVVFERFVAPRLGGQRTQLLGQLLESLVQPATAFIGVSGLYAAVQVVLISPDGLPVDGIVSSAFVTQVYEVASAAIAIWAVMRLIDVFGFHLQQRAKKDELDIDVPVIPLLQKSLKVFVGVIGVVFVLQNAGYPIAGILGGLGIGGLAIALAAQDTLANVFGSIIIFTDKPFKVGDWVIIGDVEGFVETIGFRSTRIRTWPRSLVTVPNKMIADKTITNWSAMPVRRVYFSLRIAYDATADQIEALTKRVYDIIEGHPGVDKDYYLTHFTEFGHDGLEIMIYYFTKSVVWKEHLIVKEEVNLAIMRAVEELGLSIGKPGRDLYVVERRAPLQSLEGAGSAVGGAGTLVGSTESPDGSAEPLLPGAESKTRGSRRMPPAT